MTDDELTALATAASATKESVLRRLAGLPVRGKAGERIDEVLKCAKTKTPTTERL